MDTANLKERQESALLKISKQAIIKPIKKTPMTYTQMEIPFPETAPTHKQLEMQFPS